MRYISQYMSYKDTTRVKQEEESDTRKIAKEDVDIRKRGMSSTKGRAPFKA